MSHDRYFLDRLVDKVFAFDGNGFVEDVPRRDSDYRQWKYHTEDTEEELEKVQKQKQLAAVGE